MSTISVTAGPEGACDRPFVAEAVAVAAAADDDDVKEGDVTAPLLKAVDERKGAKMF